MDLDLSGAWSGWRIRGPLLISPEGDRLTIGRLHGIVLTEFLRKTFAPKRVRQDGVVDFDAFRRKIDRMRSTPTPSG